MANLNLLNPQQREAVETLHGPVLILAGAGTGKTRVITFRIAHLLRSGIAPENIVAVTFTNKAAREMEERVAKLVPAPRRKPGEEESPRPTLCTFHSLCVRILRKHIEKLGYKRNFVIYDESEQLSAVKKVLSRFSTGKVKVDARGVLTLLSRFKNAGEDAATDLGTAEADMAERIRGHYESALKACNAVDFDDLILLVLRLFKEHPDALEACRAQYRYVMVDEYQDTNNAQFRLVHALTEKHRNLCVVGDDDQSIYGWRGAEVANLLGLEKHYPEVKVVKLEQNYRSTNTILTAANALIKHNLHRRGKKLWSQNGEGDKITLFAFENENDEAEKIVEMIEAGRVMRRDAWSDHAVLFRTNIQARPLETAFRKAKVRYHLIGGQSFFDRREVRDFLAYLKTCLNPHDDGSLLRIANVPARGLSDGTMEKLLAASQERHCSVFTVMRHTDVQDALPERARESVIEFIELIEGERERLADEASALHPKPLQKWAEELLQNTDYLADLRRTEKNPEIAENRQRILKDLTANLDNSSELLNSALPERLQGFLEQTALDQDRLEEQDNSGDAVTLITMHSCKGLEFPHVFVAGVEEGLLPHSRSKVEGTLDEERRLFYVAITRAMKTLTLSHCGARTKYGLPAPCHPSSFLEQLPDELMEDGDVAQNKKVDIERGKSLFAKMREAIQ